MWRNIASNALTLFIVVLVAAAGFVAWAKSQFTAPGPLAQAICLEVEPGSSLVSVSGDLAERGAVAHPIIFRIGADYTDRADLLKAGSFLIPEGASNDEIVEIVTRGGQSTCGTEIVYRIGVTSQVLRVQELDPATGTFETREEFDPDTPDVPELYTQLRETAGTRYRVVLAEGATSWQIAEALRHVDFLEGEIAEVPPEGMLAPSNYAVRAGADRSELLQQMQVLQQERLAEVWESRQDDLPIETPEEALILASIIEKETGVPEERRQVASVFVNRLREGIRLQTDPTVIYGITNGEGVLGRGLRRSELDAETPYNTYAIAGLPPTPIANPGLESLRAAVDPAETNYTYFVADGSGGHAFAETLAEHNENVARWRALEAERGGE
ncbi:endolytic transglycosylase MltG [Mesobaculum littorinae]|uniref:Endolytic murein transglycosylase n=1 Tax=Mesobaculum littorinae TaxID=2486419 RepID=A0A438AJN0_9RHOB|nr:endolytic transglycosylase MltG [Mesobaculum littorinae]RVV98993.1 endolytic transglycosylase MltG [Mesobaculum littorinae]